MGLFTVFADLSENIFKFVHHRAGFADESGQRLQIEFFKLQRLGIPPVRLGGVPVLGEFAGVLDEVHAVGSSWFAVSELAAGAGVSL